MKGGGLSGLLLLPELHKFGMKSDIDTEIPRNHRGVRNEEMKTILEALPLSSALQFVDIKPFWSLKRTTNGAWVHLR